MVRHPTKKVLVGDATKRWALSMPPTLATFRSRVRAAYDLGIGSPFEIHLHPYARGSQRSRGRELIASESDYACVIDGDVLVIRIRGEDAAPGPLVRAFDGDVATAYDHDYAWPAPVAEVPSLSKKSSYQNYPEEIDVPNPYVTTYGRAFTQPPAPSPSKPKPEMAAHVTCPHGAATTTYRSTFTGREPRAFHESVLEEPSLLARFVAPAAPAREPATSTMRADFVKFEGKPRWAPRPRALAAPAPGARWKPSTYRAAYAGQAPYPAPGLGAGIQYSVLGDGLSVPAPPRFATTTYQGHFAPKPVQVARKVWVDPEEREERADDFSVLSG